MAPTWDELLVRNTKYSETQHKPQPYLSEITSPPPSSFIVSCMDNRVSVETLLGIKTEDAFILRNTGGRIKPTIPDLLFLDTITQGQAIKNVIVIHHTDCGYTHSNDEAIKAALKASNPDFEKEIEGLEFGCYGSMDYLEESVRSDLRLLKSQELVREDLRRGVKGYVWDIKSGGLREIGVEV